MKCAYSKEILALYVEDDLPAAQAIYKVKSHVMECSDCRQYCEELRKSQSLIKARFRPARPESVGQETLAGVRRAVMSQIDETGYALGWAVKLERFIMLGFRRQRYAVAGFAIVAIVSASLLGQIGHSGQKADGRAAVFAGKNTLVRPAGYREWVFAGSSLGLEYEQNPEQAQRQGSEMYHNVYIDQAAYHEYTRSRKFPEGTVMVLEMVSADVKKEPGLQGSYEKDFMSLAVSVKDSSRFEGGWAYFGFTDGNGNVKPEAEPFAQSAGCLSCHQEKAETDHVFTQFYPVLRLAGS